MPVGYWRTCCNTGLLVQVLYATCILVKVINGIHAASCILYHVFADLRLVPSKLLPKLSNKRSKTHTLTGKELSLRVNGENMSTSVLGQLLALGKNKSDSSMKNHTLEYLGKLVAIVSDPEAEKPKKGLYSAFSLLTQGKGPLQFINFWSN